MDELISEITDMHVEWNFTGILVVPGSNWSSSVLNLLKKHLGPRSAHIPVWIMFVQQIQLMIREPTPSPPWPNRCSHSPPVATYRSFPQIHSESEGSWWKGAQSNIMQPLFNQVGAEVLLRSRQAAQLHLSSTPPPIIFCLLVRNGFSHFLNFKAILVNDMLNNFSQG